MELWELLAVFALALILYFEIWMLVDVILRPVKHKVWWIIGMILLHPIVAIIYFFTARRTPPVRPAQAS